MSSQGAVNQGATGARRPNRIQKSRFIISIAGFAWFSITVCSPLPVRSQAVVSHRGPMVTEPSPLENTQSTSASGAPPMTETHGAARAPTDEPGPSAAILAHLTHAITLEDAVSHHVVGQHAIGTIATSTLNHLAVAINSEATDDNMMFRTGPRVLEPGVTRWPIHVRRAAGANTKGRPLGGEPTVLGQVIARSGRLHIELDAHASDVYRRQLRNCLLVFSVGKTRHAIQLRKPVAVSPLDLDLSHASSTIDFAVSAPLPRKQCCIAELIIEESTAHALLEVPQRPLLKANQSMIVRIAKWPEAEIMLRLLVGNHGIRLKVVPRFTLNSRKYPLAPEMIAKQLALRVDQQRRNRRDLELAKKRLAKIPRDFRKVRRVKARTPAQRGIRSMHMAVLDREAATLRARMGRLASTIPKLENNIQHLRRLLPIARQLDRHVRVSARLVARTTSGDIELGMTRSGEELASHPVIAANRRE